MSMESCRTLARRSVKPVAWPSLLLLLVLSGCAAPGPSDDARGASVAVTAAPKPAPVAGSWATTAPSGVAAKFAPADVAPIADESWSMEARVVLQAIPEGSAAPAAPSLKAEYADKAALVEAVKVAHLRTSVELDGTTIHAGFGPALRFRTTSDGTVRR